MTDYAATFNRLWTLAGSPYLTCVKPYAQWTSTPTGYAYDADYDGIVNSSGTQWAVSSSADLNANDYTTVRFLPGAGDAEQALTMGGIVDDGTVFGRVLPGDYAAVNAAQWLELDGMTYNRAAVTPQPRGVGLWYAVRMNKR